jgi:hypothetical protein
VPNPHQIRAGILTRMHQIAHRLNVGVGQLADSASPWAI